jgi:hypothetical protein
MSEVTSSSSTGEFNFTKPKSSEIATIVTLLGVISFMIYLSSSGVSKVDTCLVSEKKSNSSDREHLDSLNRNKKISGFSVGLNIGMLMMALIPSAFLSTQSLVLLGGVIIALSYISISSYGKLSDDCKTTMDSFNNQSHAYLGVGIGIFVWIGLKNLLAGMNKLTLSTRVLLGFALINSIILSWVNWNTANNCDGLDSTERKEMDSFKKNNQIILVVCVFLLLLLGVSFKFFPT